MAAISSANLNHKIIKCERCPRLIKHCREIAKEKRKSFAGETYWGKPVPNFGKLPCKLLIVGLAPAAHGANRTGRMFTGDRSGEWLYRALFKAGFASQPTSTSSGDGLELISSTITAVAHCAPPDNKPTPQEIDNCQEYLRSSLKFSEAQVIICLGGIAWNETLKCLGIKTKKPKFHHAGSHTVVFEGRTILLIASYHPSQQNTFTGRLTEPMFDQVFKLAQKHLA